MTWFEYLQNNSGGSHDIDADEGIGVCVFIEADNSDDANERAEEIDLYFNGCDTGMDCECCGDRWHKADEDDAGNIEEMKSSARYWASWGPSFAHPLGSKFYEVEDEKNAKN